MPRRLQDLGGAAQGPRRDHPAGAPAYLAGRKDEAVAAVPDEFFDESALVGLAVRIRERFRPWADCGINGLKGNPRGFHSIRINDQWRIVFRWTDSGPAEVDIRDYH